jgi:hypothetical protein
LSAIDAADRAQFDLDGYVVRPGALPAAACDALCEHLSRTIAAVAAAYSRGERDEYDFWSLLRRSRHGLEVFWEISGSPPKGAPPEAWERLVMRVGHGLHRADERFLAFCRESPIAAPLAMLAGEPARIVQTSVIYKQPRSQTVQFGLHQDSSYLTVEPDSLVLAFVALDDMDEENGCLEVVPQSHTSGLGTRLVLGDQGFAPLGRGAPPPAPERARRLPMEKGSIVFVHGRTYHASGPNRSDRPRRALIVHAVGGGARMLPTSWIQEPEGGFTPMIPDAQRT